MDQIYSMEHMPFLSTKDDVNDQFMIVPTAFEEPILASQFDEYLLEANFAGVTGTILSPGVDESNFCTIVDGGAGGQPVSDIAFNQASKQFSFQHQLKNEPISYSNGDAAFGNLFVQQFVNIDFDFGGQQIDQQQPRQDIGVYGFDGQQQQLAEVAHRQISELDDPTAVWLTENADLKLIEQMTSENEQQCQLLDDLLRDDDVFVEEPDDDDDYGEESDESEPDPRELLNEIYREAQQMEFAPVDNAVWTRRQLPAAPARPRGRPPIVPRIQSNRDHDFGSLADHNFGAARRGRPPGSTSRKRGVKREAVLKSKKRYQNREAALRYRLKKRAEKVEQESGLDQLLKRNQMLKNEKYSLTAEVDYLKDLLLEIRKLKGFQK